MAFLERTVLMIIFLVTLTALVAVGLAAWLFARRRQANPIVSSPNTFSRSCFPFNKKRTWRKANPIR